MTVEPRGTQPGGTDSSHAGQEPITVHLFPSPARRMVNPYLSMLTAALREQGVDVQALHGRSGAAGGRGIVHVHWPELNLHSGKLRWALWGTGKLIVQVVAARRRGLPVVWTVHNLQAHDGSRPVLQRILWAAWPRLVTGWLSLSRNGVDRAQDAFRPLRRRPSRVVPHGDYAPVVHAPDRAVARGRLGLPLESRVLALVGRIRPYKGAEALVEAVAASPSEDLRLVVGGACDDAPLRAALERTAAADPRVRLLLETLHQEQVDDVLAAADLVVLPFRSVFNSGSVLLCLTAGRPVLAPRTPVFDELAAEVGAGWLHLYDGDLTPEVLERVLAETTTLTGEPDLRRHRWENVAAEHLAFYERLLRRSTARAGEGRR
ncbi:glycosyl transferase group 1 [Kineococcus radiotolerans SRS30216 = ATCC BAA-149]|uniref:Glycosyl transferase group 1 n=2 Tax=Kineococcus radiotolerans TaxID=131568 RepID=A6WEA3_KINRD|nr:glycosyl transferase group 1 [Kineococcus radiotolerans SRS30216 = ATCC BAA-149]